MKKIIQQNISFLIFASLILVAKGSFADQNLVPSGSMEPTLQVGDFILVNKLAYDLHLPFSRVLIAKLGEPGRGDIVVFINPVNQLRMVKRLIGLPGDVIDIRNGFVRINGQELPGTTAGELALENFAHEPRVYEEIVGTHTATIRRTPDLFRPDMYHLVVPEGSYFAMGDNRDNSLDSRAWGFIPRENIEGRATNVTVSAWLEPWPKIAWDRTAKSLN